MSSSHPTISVIIPVYNGSKTIQSTVNSVLEQSWQDFELLIINDGSTDNTLTILNEIDDARLRVLSFENAGVAESRNRGIEAAQGDYLSFLDADDRWTVEKLEKQLEALIQHPEADAAYSWTDYIDEQDQFVHHGWHTRHSGEVYTELVQCCFIENGSNILLRKAVLEHIGAFDQSVSPAEDWDFYLRLAEVSRFICVPEVQILYRISEGSQSANVLKMEKAGVAVLTRQFAKSQELLRCYGSSSWVDFYSYLFHRAWKNADCRQSCQIALQVFIRGMRRDSQLFQKIATRRLLRLCWHWAIQPRSCP